MNGGTAGKRLAPRLGAGFWRAEDVNTPTYHGVVRGHTVVLLETPVPLVDGTRVLVTPLVPEPGTPAALLAAMEAEPHLSPEDVEALERAIAEGQRPSGQVDLFLVQEAKQDLEAKLLDGIRSPLGTMTPAAWAELKRKVLESSPELNRP
jgi:hypothetical protein